MGISYGRAQELWLAKEIETILLGKQHISWKGVVSTEYKADMHPRSQGRNVLPLNQKLLFLLDMTILRSTSSWTRTSRPRFASGTGFECICVKDLAREAL